MFIYGLSDDPGADHRRQIQSAIDAAHGWGGGTVRLPPWNVGWDGDILVKGGVNIEGHGAGKGPKASTLHALSADARIIFGGTTEANSRGARSGGFNIDGGGVATRPLWVRQVVSRTFESLMVFRSAGTGWRVDRAQNCLFLVCDSYDAAGDGFHLDEGAGGNTFIRNEVTGSGGWGVNIEETVGTGPYPRPTHNTWVSGVIERTNPTTKATAGCIRHAAGYANTFYSPMLSATSHTGPGLVSVESPAAHPSTLTLVNPTINGGAGVTTATAIAAACGLWVQGRGLFQNHAVGMDGASNAYGRVDEIQMSNVATHYVGMGQIRRMLTEVIPAS